MVDSVDTPVEAPEPTPGAEGTVPAVEPVVLATPETPDPEPRVFTQAELDQIIGKRIARERRAWEREHAAQPASKPGQPNVDLSRPITPDQFDTPEDFHEARARQLQAEREAQDQYRRQVDAYVEREEAARDRYDNYDDVTRNPNVPITDAMVAAIMESEVGPDIAYFLGSNPSETKRIGKLNPFLQAKEIGRIEAKIAAEPPTRKTSSAPAPIRPVKPRADPAPVYDTTDPRSIESMDTNAWIAAERDRVRKQWEARR